MPKNLTRHRRAAKRGGQTAPYVAPAPAPMPTYVAPAPTYPPPAEESWTDKIKGLGTKLKGYLPNSDATTTTSSTTAAPPSSWFGGRKRMRGGNVNASDPLSLATNASPISGIASARAHNWVGGRTRAQKRSRSQGRSRSRSRSRSQSRRRAQSRSRKYRRARH